MNKLVNNVAKIVPVIFVFFMLFSCSTAVTEDDPLKYSKKLIKQGHVSLYDNGAFKVPQTQIKLIPAANTPIELAGEMMGIRARQSFLTSLNNAADSVDLIPAGSQLSLEYATNIKTQAEQAGDSVTSFTRPVGILLADRSVDFGVYVALES